MKCRIGSVVIPVPISKAISRLLTKYPPNKTDILRLRESLISTIAPSKRSDAIEPFVLEYGPRESMAYLGLRFSSSFSVLTNILSQLKSRFPDFKPNSLIDFGCGSGAASLAALHKWESIQNIFAIDSSTSQLDLYTELQKEIKHELIISNTENQIEPTISQKRYLGLSVSNKKDLVLASFVMGELGSDRILETTLKTLWSNTGNFLVLVERGNPNGYKTIAKCRALILESDPHARIVAPCSHNLICPLLSTKHFCSFSQRYQVSSQIMKLSNSKTDLFDASFSFIIIEKLDESGFNTNLKKDEDHDTNEDEIITDPFKMRRIIMPPKKKKGHVILNTCAPSGNIEKLIVAKSHGDDEYKVARKSHWGDLWPYHSTVQASNQEIEIETPKSRRRKDDDDDDRDQ